MSNGEMTARRRPRKATRPFEWSWLTEDEKEFFRNLSRTWGASTPIVVKVQPSNPIYAHSNIFFGYTGGIIVNDLPEYDMMLNGLLYSSIGSAAFELIEV
jgi:hypothetical protein